MADVGKAVSMAGRRSLVPQDIKWQYLVHCILSLLCMIMSQDFIEAHPFESLPMDLTS